MWSDHAHTMVVDETRPYDPDDPAPYRAYLDWYAPRTRCRLTTGEPPQPPLHAVHGAAIQEGPDRHLAARVDEAVREYCVITMAVHDYV